jgi:hypothetical protein
MKIKWSIIITALIIYTLAFLYITGNQCNADPVCQLTFPNSTPTFVPIPTAFPPTLSSTYSTTNTGNAGQSAIISLPTNTPSIKQQ